MGPLAGFLRGWETVKDEALATERGRVAQDNPEAHPERLAGTMLPEREGHAGKRGAAEKLGVGTLCHPPDGAELVPQARGQSGDLHKEVT